MEKPAGSPDDATTDDSAARRSPASRWVLPFCLGRPALAADFFWYSKKTNRPRKREAAVAE